MKFELLVIGKTDSKNIQALLDEYSKRLKKYCSYSIQVIPDLKNSKNLSFNEQKDKEGKLILNKLSSGDRVILLDDKGQQFSSMEFSKYIQKTMNSGGKKVVFIVGGPYGFSEEIYARSQGKISLSKMTFSHQMVRLFFTEQLYRGFTILNNEPYHHE